MKPVAITGYGAVTPCGVGAQPLWEGVLSGKSFIDYITAFDASDYSTRFAAEVKNFNPFDYISPKKADKMDRFCQFAFVAANEAIKSSGLEITEDLKPQIGSIIGSGIGGIITIEQNFRNLFEKGPRRISPFLIPMMITNIASGEIAIEWGLRGANFAIASACASSGHAIGVAMRLIQSGDVKVVITGGAEASLTPLAHGAFCRINALSRKNDDPAHASKPFDKERDGFVIGEGAGILVLEDMEFALSRGAKIYAELVGVGMTDDAYHEVSPEPSGLACYEAIAAALKDGNIPLSEVDYINAHGTSTPLNDKTETAAIKKAFGDYAYKIPISSTKSTTGHLLGAAGSIELIVTVQAIQKGIIPPTINYKTPDPECDLDYVPNKPREKKIRYALSNSFGFGGHNAVLAVKNPNI